MFSGRFSTAFAMPPLLGPLAELGLETTHPNPPPVRPGVIARAGDRRRGLARARRGESARENLQAVRAAGAPRAAGRNCLRHASEPLQVINGTHTIPLVGTPSHRARPVAPCVFAVEDPNPTPSGGKGGLKLCAQRQVNPRRVGFSMDARIGQRLNSGLMKRHAATCRPWWRIKLAMILEWPHRAFSKAAQASGITGEARAWRTVPKHWRAAQASRRS